MEPVDFEDEATLYSLSSEYFEAAKILHSTPPEKVNYSFVVYYLLGHTAELLIKSYLHKQGISIDDLRTKFGHDLSKLVRKSYEYGFPPEFNMKNIMFLSSSYKLKNLEYRKNIPCEHPSSVELIEDLRCLQNYVFSEVADFNSFEYSEENIRS